jgi:hypothetical protein
MNYPSPQLEWLLLNQQKKQNKHAGEKVKKKKLKHCWWEYKLAQPF